MTNQIAEITSSPTGLKAVVEFILLHNRNVSNIADRVEVKFILGEELENRVRDAINSYHVQKHGLQN
jgi:hypothetical protein